MITIYWLPFFSKKVCISVSASTPNHRHDDLITGFFYRSSKPNKNLSAPYIKNKRTIG